MIDEIESRYPIPPGPRTWTGTALLLVVPLPSSPALLRPQSQTVPSDFSTICSEPPPPQIEMILGEELVGFLRMTSAPSPAAWAGPDKSPSNAVSVSLHREV